MGRRNYRREASCVICEESFSTSRYSTALTCSRACTGFLQRKNSESKLRLNAFDEWTPNMAYALGLVFSDGNLSKPVRGSWRIQFTSTDKSQAQWIHDFVGNPHPLREKRPKQQHVNGKALRKRPKVQYLSTTVSDSLGARLFELGIRPDKSQKGTALKDLPKGMESHFLRGVCDGDGSVMLVKNAKMPEEKNLRVSIVCVPQRDREFLALLLKRLNVRFSQTEKAVRMDGSAAERFCQQVYVGDPCACLSRKRDVWDRWRKFRRDVGGLISARDSHASLRGLRPQTWHRWFGRLPDKEIAALTSLSVSNVALARKKAGFAAVPPTKRVSGRPWHPLVGMMPDLHVARAAGISPSTVFHYRKKQGIPVFSEIQRVKALSPTSQEL